jgi:hypothetical protein
VPPSANHIEDLSFENQDLQKAAGCAAAPMSGPLDKSGFWQTSLVLTFAMVVLLRPVSADTAKPSHHAVMAAMIAKFPPVVKWPAGSLDRAGKELTLAVFTEDKAVFQLFKDKLHNQERDGIKWKVTQVRTAKAAMEYLIVFFEKRVTEPSDAWYAKVKDRGILTFGEKNDEGARNTVLTFVIVPEKIKQKIVLKVKFDVDLGVAAKAGVKLAPRMGRVARKVIQAK